MLENRESSEFSDDYPQHRSYDSASDILNQVMSINQSQIFSGSDISRVNKDVIFDGLKKLYKNKVVLSN